MLQEIRALTRRLQVPLVVNDRPDLAVLAEADYVHVGQDDLPVEAARRFGLAVGQSTHAPAELDASGADYLGVGPVYETPTKSGRAAAGLDYVRLRSETRTPPVVRHRGHRRDERSRGRRRRRRADRSRPSDHRGRGSREGGGLAASDSARLIATMGRPFWRSPVAQLAEHPAVNRRVVGSSPTRGVEEAPAGISARFRGELQTRSGSVRASG